MNDYIYKDKKKLRRGYTTGSCAAAAAKAATYMLLYNEKIEKVSIMTPKGIKLHLDICDIEYGNMSVSCAVEKDAGDDYDVTNKIHVHACVKKIDSGIVIDGGKGIGRVTKPGLDRSIGEAAINTTPRLMIKNEVLEVIESIDYHGGISVIISVDEGEEIAKKTFNERLGIIGGISILGTSGIVEPMSESALVDTIRAEMSMLSATGSKSIIITPGNYGENFIRETLSLELDKSVKCSNYIGDTIDMGYEFNIENMLLIGHIGKIVKLGAGVMNTHSKNADARLETLASCALYTNVDKNIIIDILESVTTDNAIDIIINNGILEEVMNILMKKIEYHINKRAYEGLNIGVITFSNKYGILGKTDNAMDILNIIKER